MSGRLLSREDVAGVVDHLTRAVEGGYSLRS
jgi:hypothetical protein